MKKRNQLKTNFLGFFFFFLSGNVSSTIKWISHYKYCAQKIILTSMRNVLDSFIIIVLLLIVFLETAIKLFKQEERWISYSVRFNKTFTICANILFNKAFLVGHNNIKWKWNESTTQRNKTCNKMCWVTDKCALSYIYRP